MAKVISLLKTDNIPFANQNLKLSKTIGIEKIEEHPRFKSLFPIKTDVVERIADNIKKNGYDSSQPVHIWVKKENDTEHLYLIDGYTRLSASKKAGLVTIPYFSHTNFETEEDAVKYALHLQVDRRNLEGTALLNAVKELMGTDYIQNFEGNKNAAIGELIGKSEKTVERSNYVMANATEEQLAKIDEGSETPNSIYNELKSDELINKSATEEQKAEIEAGTKNKKEVVSEIKQAKKAKKEAEAETDFDDELSDALEDNSENPAPVFIHERKEQVSDRLPPEVDSERTYERKQAYELGLKKGSDLAYEIFDYICSELENGKSIQDIKDDEHFSDFSVYKIYKAFSLDENSQDSEE